MSSICTSNVTSGFIDLATFDELEKYMYGGPDATAYFVRETRKSTWFTQVPVVLSRASGNPAFDTEWSVSISRAGDYLLATWLRLTTPEIKLAAFAPVQPPAIQTVKAVRWTRNFMHNIIREACITFNDLVAARFDSWHLDFWTAFTVPASKRNGYNNMVGNFSEMTDPQLPLTLNGQFSGSATIKPFVLNLPLPFFYARDSGVALPTAALPYNDMRLNFSFRSWEDLLIVDTFTNSATGYKLTSSACATQSDLATGSSVNVSNVQVWANYAIVSNDERKRMACAPRDILIEQVQTAPKQTFVPSSMSRFDIRFSHAIKVLFFSVRNYTVKCSWSNYTAGQPVLTIDGGGADGPYVASVNYTSESMVDPISVTSLIYENTNRLSSMGSDYFSLVSPWYSAPAIPNETGYHMYSYSLDFISLDPMGSTNYGKLTNVSIVPEGSKEAKEYAAYASATQADKDKLELIGINENQIYEFIVTAVNNNIVRISGGALGFPVL
jgi:hypothetical protein